MEEDDLEKRDFVDQKFSNAIALIESRPEIFSAQGTVVETWRTYGGKKLGPYFRLSFRDEKRQRSVYLGKSAELAGRVRAVLASKQETIKQRRAYQRVRVQLVAELRRHKTAWEKDLHELGLHAKGFEVRGWRQNTRIMTTGYDGKAADDHVEDVT